MKYPYLSTLFAVRDSLLSSCESHCLPCNDVICLMILWIMLWWWRMNCYESPQKSLFWTCTRKRERKREVVEKRRRKRTIFMVKTSLAPWSQVKWLLDDVLRSELSRLESVNEISKLSLSRYALSSIWDQHSVRAQDQPGLLSFWRFTSRVHCCCCRLVHSCFHLSYDPCRITSHDMKGRHVL